MMKAAGTMPRIFRQPNGKPVANGTGLSVAHAGPLTIAAAGTGEIGCDLELVGAKSVQAWGDMLGEDSFHLARVISRECAESLDTAATRLWTARESLLKAGLAATAPLVLQGNGEKSTDGWVLLRSGSTTVCTCVASVAGFPGALVAAVALHAEGRNGG